MIEAAETIHGVTAAPGTTKARIERAALNLFVAKGIDSATTREIASAAGVSEGALYRHFKGKEEIARHLFEAIHEKLATVVRQAGASASVIEEQAHAIVDAYCRTADADWSLFSYHLLSMAHFIPTPPGADDPVTATEDIILTATERGELIENDAKLLAAMTLGVVLQPALHTIYGRLQGPLSGHSQEFQSSVATLIQRYRQNTDENN